jgi:hypothetical protein
MPPAGQKIDPTKLPGDSTIVLTPDELQKLLDKARLEGRTKQPPTECRLHKGEIKGSFIFFDAEFACHAERADAVFALACGQAKIVAVSKPDGRTPLLFGDSNGYFVQVEQVGDYSVTLSLSVPLTQRPGGGRGLELDLPRAVVTTLELTLPPDVRAVRVNGKDAAESSLSFKDHRLEGPLGIVDKLDLSWQGPAPAGVPSVRTVRCRTTVHVESGWITAEAVLTLHAQGEPTTEWTIVVPSGFDVKASTADPQRIKSLEQENDPAGVAWTVTLTAPSNDDVTATATKRMKLAAGQQAPIGPFLVRGADRQSGAILVGAAGPDARPIWRPHADLTLRDLTDEERKADPTLTAAYEYAAAPAAPWLEVEAGSAGGSVKTRKVFTLTLGPTGPENDLEWRVAAAFTVAVSGRTPLDHLDVVLPPECEFVPSSPPDAGVAPDGDNPHLLHVTLNGVPTAPAAFSVAARYDAKSYLPVSPKVKAHPFTLPYLSPSGMRELQDGGVQIDVNAPDDVELLPPSEAEVKDPHHYTWRSATTPKDAELSWQPYIPEVRVSSVIDVTFQGGRAQVRHEMHLHFLHAAPKQVTLKVPSTLGATLQAADQGGALADIQESTAGTRILKLLGPGPDQTATLLYSFPVKGPTAAVPLATVDQARGGDARVRVWCDPGRLPSPPGGDWSELDIEEVPNAHRLPVLVLQSMKPDAPLTLSFTQPAAGPTVLLDRALYRAELKDDVWTIRSTYLLRQPADDHLDVELPDAPSALRLRAKLDDKEVDPETQEQSEADGRPRHIARFRLGAALFLKPVVLDLTYRLPQHGTLQNTLHPLRLIGDAGQAPTRWQITLPSDAVALAPEAGAAARWTVGLRNGLPVPQLAVTNQELEQWFAGADVPWWPKGDAVSPTLVAWQEDGSPLNVVLFPSGIWMAFCSIPLVLLGLLLFVLARRSWTGGRIATALFWGLAFLLTAAVGAAWTFYPTTLYAVAYGCEVGAAVLVLMLLFLAVTLERYRRRIVFLPNFRRARSGSSLTRAAIVASKPAGEPSTVDAPHPAGSSSQQPA